MKRLAYLDWLRFFVVLSLTPFHIFMDNWFMHLLFLVSGIGAFHSLGERDAGSFIGERAFRLTLPLGIGTLAG